MFSETSPFLNIPAALDRKPAVFLDGLRHAAHIADLAYTRLCAGLTKHAENYSKGQAQSEFTHLFLDAWAFIDATDRFRCLWEMQPNAETIPEPFSPKTIRHQLQGIRELRNVSAHVAQKIDQIVAVNSSVLGSISWLSIFSQSPLKIKTCFIRPGIIQSTVSDQLAVPKGKDFFVNESGCISVTAGKHKVMLSSAYELVRNTVTFAENHLNAAFQHPSLAERCPSDMFGIADLDTNGA